ncbi:MAG: hypothetical protein AAF629_27840 [Chloroflexota bacterium]
MPLHADDAFAVLDLDLHLERIAGGNETEVYRTDDAQYVVKVKSGEEAETLTIEIEHAFLEAITLQQVADNFAVAVGTDHSIDNYFVLTQNSAGHPQVLAIQPYLEDAVPLFNIDYTTLSSADRKAIAKQLRRIIARSLKHYQRSWAMPDLYGRISQSKKERKRLNAPHMLPWRLWSFIVERNLLRANNLMMVRDPELRIVLVDYDPVKRGELYKFIYYTARRILFWRDYLLIAIMEKTGYVPTASK